MVKSTETDTLIPNAIQPLTKTWLAAGLTLLLIAAGCQTAQIPDPNDPANAAIVSVEDVQLAVRGVADEIGLRVASASISKEKGDEELHARVSEFANSMNIDDLKPEDAWRAGEIFMLAGQNERAEKYLRQATQKPANDDRRTNDLIRLAVVLARENKIREAIETAEKSFSAQPSNKGSILLGITKELVPAAQGKGNDAALAHLIEGAIEQHLAADVPTTTPEGRAFHAAQAFHVREAFDLAIQIYQRIGRNSSAAKLLRIRRDTLNQLSHQIN